MTVVNVNVISVNYGLHVNAAARQHDISVCLMNGEKADININRKMLSEIAISDDKAFGELVSKLKML